MQVLKVMNNSLLLALDDSGNECILMGKGIGYKKSIGATIEESEIQKTFFLKDKQMLSNFVQLASSLDDSYFNLVKEIIDYAIKEYRVEVMDYLYLSLSDHVAFVVKRLKEGNIGENFNYVEVMIHHKIEYEIGKYAVKLINQELGVSLPESEATAIGLHFVNAKLDSPSLQKEQIIGSLVRNIETIIQRSYGGSIDKDTFTYSRFFAHLNYFCERIYENTLFEDDDSDELYLSLSSKMPNVLSIVEIIDNFIQKDFGVSITQQEKIYLFVHLHRIVEK